MSKDNGKLQQLNSDRTTTNPDPSVMNVWVISSGKEPQPGEDKGNMEWVVKVGSYSDHMTSCGNEDLNSYEYFSLVCYKYVCAWC